MGRQWQGWRYRMLSGSQQRSPRQPALGWSPLGYQAGGYLLAGPEFCGEARLGKPSGPACSLSSLPAVMGLGRLGNSCRWPGEQCRDDFSCWQGATSRTGASGTRPCTLRSEGAADGEVTWGREP